MKNIVPILSLLLQGAVAGALLGWAYWHWIGCHNNHDAVANSPISSMIYFSIISSLIAGVFTKQHTQSNQ